MRLHLPLDGAPPLPISIHAPLAGCDLYFCHLNLCSQTFQSTHPLRGATRAEHLREAMRVISIHAPLAGCDRMACRQSIRQMISIHAPLAGCDAGISLVPNKLNISIHAPLAGCDFRRHLSGSPYRYFNPRTPCGVRRAPRYRYTPRAQFQSTHPLRGATARP